MVFGRRLRHQMRLDVVLIVLVSLAVLVAAAVWASAMISPVHRVGNPSTAPSPTPSLPVVTPTPSPTPTPTPTPTPSPPAPPKPSTMTSSDKYNAATLNVNSAGSAGTLRTFGVRVETTAGLDANNAATQVMAVLNDPRSWAGSGNVRFALVADAAQDSFVVTLASPATIAKYCAATSGSCLAGTTVMVDAMSWTNPPATYGGDAAAWQAYLVNHAVGVLLGKKSATCPGAGAPAPIMAPQETDLGGCVANPWPTP